MHSFDDIRAEQIVRGTHGTSIFQPCFPFFFLSYIAMVETRKTRLSRVIRSIKQIIRSLSERFPFDFHSRWFSARQRFSSEEKIRNQVYLLFSSAAYFIFRSEKEWREIRRLVVIEDCFHRLQCVPGVFHGKRFARMVYFPHGNGKWKIEHCFEARRALFLIRVVKWNRNSILNSTFIMTRRENLELLL